MWLTAVRDGRGGEMMAARRARIFTTSGGRVYVPVQADQRLILAARRNAAEARAVAMDLARANKTELQLRLGRPASVRDLYAAHMFGLDGAARLAGLKATQPVARVASVLPELGAVFPEAAVLGNRAATVAEFYQRLPDGAEALSKVNLAQIDGTSPPLPAAAQMVSRQEPASADRTAPLRGIIKDVDRAPRTASAPVAAARLAALTWTTEVRRTP